MLCFVFVFFAFFFLFCCPAVHPAWSVCLANIGSFQHNPTQAAKALKTVTPGRHSSGSTPAARAFFFLSFFGFPVVLLTSTLFRIYITSNAIETM